MRTAGTCGRRARDGERVNVRRARMSASARAASSSLRGSGVQEKSCSRRKLSLAFCRELLYDRQDVRHGTQSAWGYSSVGRALRSQCRSQGFESPYLHHRVGARFALLRRFFAFGRCIRRKKPPPHRSPAPSVLREGFRLLRLIYDETGARSRRRISFSAPQSAAGAESAARRGGRAAANRAMRAARQKWGAARQKCGGRGSGWRGGRGRQIEPCVQRVKSGAQRVKNETGNAGAADARVFSCFAVYWNQPASQIAPIAVTNGR